MQGLYVGCKCLVIQFLKFKCILLKTIANEFRHIACQLGVAVKQPPAEGDAVCLVIEFLRVEPVKMIQFIVLQYIRVKGSHAVDAETVVDVNVGHVNPVALVNDIYGWVLKFPAHLVIQYFHNGYQLGNRFLKIVHGPGLQGFRQDGVVGVSAGIHHHLDGVIHFHAMLRGEKTNQFGNDHGGVGVIDLDNSIVGQVVKGGALCRCLVQYEAGSVAYHEVLLVNAQYLACPVAVVRVEEQGQVLPDIGLVKGNPFLHKGFIHGLHVK